MKSRLLQGCRSTLFSFLPKAGTNIHYSSTFSKRLKSSIAIDSPANKIWSASANLVMRLSDNTKKPAASVHLSSNYLETGLNHFKNSDYFQAEACFDNIIAFAYEKEFINLTASQKNIVARALTSKAKIVAVGTDEDMDTAENLLKMALELSPHLKEAKQFLSSLRSERPESVVGRKKF
jgi:hypothetical protein